MVAKSSSKKMNSCGISGENIGVLTIALLLIIFCSEQMCSLSKKDGIYELVCCQMFERICILGPKGNGL